RPSRPSRSGTMDEENEKPDTRRSVLTGLLGGLGIAALQGCKVKDSSAAEPTGSIADTLSGTSGVAWVDTILGAQPQFTRIGDLAALAYSSECPIVVAKGCLAAGDGGGGVFFWDTTTGTDDGGTFIKPNGTGVGDTGMGWRRIYDGA